MDLISRASSEIDIDSHSLRDVLDSISADLATPFLEKRARSKSHKKSPLEELSAVIQEITGRERELQAAIGIAKMLLDRNDDLIRRKKKIFNKKHYFKNLVKQCQKEIEDFKEQIINADEKYQQVNEALVKSEEDQLKILAENKRILYEASFKQEPPRKESSETYENELFEVKSRFKEQYDNLFSSFYLGTKLDNEKKIKALDEALAKSEKEKYAMMETISKFEKDQTKLSKKLKTQEDLSKEVDISKNSFEEKCRDLTITNLRLKAQNEKLLEDLKVYQDTNESISLKKPKVRRQFSLKSELESIDEEMAHEQSPHHSYTLSRGFSQEKSLNVSLSQCIAHISAKKSVSTSRRKDPSEEYFTLITQAVKLNSPYMDAICVIPPHVLYERALKDDIPFHKWHLWVESQLNSAYIQIVYKTDIKIKPGKV